MTEYIQLSEGELLQKIQAYKREDGECDTPLEVWEELLERLKSKIKRKQERQEELREVTRREAEKLVERDQQDPPYVKGSKTSRQAAQEIRKDAPNKRIQVLAFLLEHPDGRTDEEIQNALDMAPSTERPRRVELHDMDLVVDSNRTRETSTGNDAVIWTAWKHAGKQRDLLGARSDSNGPREV